MNYIEKIAEVDSYIRKNLSEKRYIHSVEVAKMSYLIADKVDLDCDKAYLSGLAHDIAREINKELLSVSIKDISGLSNDFLELHALYHGPVGAKFLVEKFHINDSDILNGVKYHSVGHPNMGNLAKCVFVADYISADRKHINSEFRAMILNQDLDTMVASVLLESKKYLNSRGKSLIKESIDLFNLVHK